MEKRKGDWDYHTDLIAKCKRPHRIELGIGGSRGQYLVVEVAAAKALAGIMPIVVRSVAYSLAEFVEAIQSALHTATIATISVSHQAAYGSVKSCKLDAL